jgi:sulfotransferase family protein
MMDTHKRTFSSELEQLTEVLDEALLLLDSNRTDAELPVHLDAIQPSLFEQCIELCQEGARREVEPIRTIHHLSCTGGTLITKCLAAMPNVLVLNEVAPLSTINFKPDKPAFTPTDMLSLVRQGNQKAPVELLIQLFLQNLDLLRNELASIGNRILVRDHSHSHFLTGANIPEQPCLLSIIKNLFQTISVVTVRDPVDSYLSLQKNGWLHFKPGTFNEYCRRYHLFLDAHENVPMFRYEDFVRDPSSVVNQMCHIFQFNFSDNFIDTFDTFKFSGDSGRSGNMIENRPRRMLTKEFLNSVKDSELYIKLINRMGYSSCFSATCT